MADSKITALTAISTVDPTADPLVIVDVSDTSMAASGTTKKSTINQLLGAGGTATLASATITGDLTVDTNVLKVDTTNNRVGINTASPSTALDVFGGNIRLVGGNIFQILNTSNDSNVDISNNGGAGVASMLFKVAGTSAMTLNSTGLGVGVSPAFKLQVVGTSGSLVDFCGSGVAGLQTLVRLRTATGNTNGLLIQGNVSNDEMYINNFYNAALSFGTNNTERMRLDASGNLLVGKTAASVTTIGFQTLANGEASVAMAASTGASTTLNVWSTGAAAYRFYVGMNGTISATNTTISAISDARLKENVQDIDVGLGAILALKPRKFDWKAGKGKDIKGDRGFIAQEFEQVFPQLVDEWKDAAPEGEAPYKSVRQDLIPVLVKAIQELAAEVNALKNA